MSDKDGMELVDFPKIIIRSILGGDVLEIIVYLSRCVCVLN